MKSSQIYGLLGSFLSGIIIVLLLMFVFMPFEKEEEEEGIMVSFGDGIEGLGETVAETATASPITPPPTPPKEELMTQEDEETVALEAQKKKEREKKRQQEMLIAEQKRQEVEQAAKTAKANQMADVFGQKISSVGQTSGSNTAGNPAGGGSSNGNDWSLSGRDLRGGIPRPEYNANEGGIIVVSIGVDEKGNVISATTNGKDTNGKTTNITDRALLEMTLAAAKKVKFSPGKNKVYGTITYNFILN